MGRGSLRIKVDQADHKELEHLEDTLTQLQQDFEEELAAYEKTEQKLRQMKSNLLAADFMETFLNDDPDLLELAADMTVPAEASPNVPPDLVRGSTESDLAVIESSVISPSRKSTQSPPASPFSPDSTAREKMKLMWEKIKQLETLLEDYRNGLRVRMDKIKRTEKEIKTLTLNLNGSRSPCRDKELARSELMSVPEQQVFHESVEIEPAEEENVVSLSVGRERLERIISFHHPEEEKESSIPLLSPSQSHITVGSDSKVESIQLASPAVSAATMEEGSHVEVSVVEDPRNRFKISRKSWIICAVLNAFVVLVTIGFVIAANQL